MPRASQVSSTGLIFRSFLDKMEYLCLVTGQEFNLTGPYFFCLPLILFIVKGE
jgi:hypothetical protein